MGGEQSTLTASYNEEVEKINYELIKQEYDRRFGDIGIFRDLRTGKKVWIKESWIKDETTASRIVQYINTPEYHNKCFITIKSRLIDKTQNQVCSTCSMGKKLIVLLEYFERDLEGEIMRRAETEVSIYL